MFSLSQNINIYHGSQQIVSEPKFGEGKIYNDYGQGFYCTENIELAKEWACQVKHNGYANKYILQTQGLKIINLTSEEFNILNWIAILLANRKFDINNNVGAHAKEYLLNNFLPDVKTVDVLIGYRADDSYFSFAEDFVNNVISVRDLNMAMKLGSLGEQIVLRSQKAFEQITFVGYEIADHSKYHPRFKQRDVQARLDYKQRKKSLSVLLDDLFVLDIIREEMKNDDPRLQFHISEQIG